MALAEYMLSLKSELDNDPLGRGYSTMTDQEVADDLNTEYRTQNINSFSGDFMFSRTDPTEFSNLTDHKQDLWNSFCSKASVDPWESNNVEFVKFIFGDSSTTVSNLSNSRTEFISRAEDLGYNSISAAQVTTVRSY